MLMSEIVHEISFTLGIPANQNVENISIEDAVLSAFRECKRYIRTPADKTVPFCTRMDLTALGIRTKKILNIKPARPRLGLTLGSIDSGNVFQIAAAVNSQSSMGTASNFNIDPIMSEMAMAQVRNTLSTDFHWRHDLHNNVVYCTHKDPHPAFVTIQYVPDYQDVSEIEQDSWVDYIIRLATAKMKVALGRCRSKYRVEGSNVSLDGDTLLSEGNAELEQLREELESKRIKITVVN